MLEKGEFTNGKYALLGFGFTTWSIYFFVVGLIGWFVVGVLWNDRAIMLIHIVAFAALLFAYGNWGLTEPDSVPVGWAIAGWLVMGLGWMYYWPTTLAIVSKAAPPRMASTLMGVAFLSPFVAHVMAGWVGSYFDQMTPSTFWAMDAAIGAVGATLILLLRKPLQRGLETGLNP